ncbi:serine hydrolase domain-containing protein [Algoriphagus sp. CAU 1675]|uniref:serine hydrolase domain-containing protein n=1 Tax=Algoriphagus sp. CAU 1675 TaxID=3032597 RepID=UPI0023DBD008|nr:serine hydrolase domain-containing protein [Algoriphagus sp. CAU 1675]MDF2157302.1 serine hydrolase [Algoriphagus sp. CAU 1675]
MKPQIIRILRIIMPLMALASLVIFVPWTLVSVWLAPLPVTVQEQANAAIGYGLDGIIVYVDQGGKEPVSYTAGLKNRENKIPADPNSLFKIASISKLYIATATAKLANDQRLSLDATLADYLPELKERIENADQITLRMLVQHRSGIPNYSDYPDYPWDHAPDNQGALAFVLDTPADFLPNEKYAYSNTNYLLIGEILDRTLGYSHHDYIRQEILLPHGLNHTYNLLSEVDIDKVMSGYFVGYGPDIKNNDFPNPGGSMVATIQDVGKFLRILNDGSLLNDDEQAIYSSIYDYGHTGLVPGYSSIARYHADIDAVVIQFVNTSGGDTWTISEMIYNRIVKILKKGKDKES